MKRISLSLSFPGAPAGLRNTRKAANGTRQPSGAPVQGSLAASQQDANIPAILDAPLQPDAVQQASASDGQPPHDRSLALRKQWARLTTPDAQLRLAWGLTILATLTYIVLLTLESLFRYWNYQATAFDLGNYSQAIWNTLHGRFFEFTNRGWDYYGPPTRLAIHVEPIILPISLLYLIYSGPQTLLVLQSIALGLGAIPVFLLTRHWMPRWPLLGFMLVVTYLASPTLIGQNLFDFHPVTLATPLLIAAVLAMVKQRYGWFLLAAGLATMCKEDVGIVVAFLGVYIAFWQHRRKLGLSIAALALGWSAFCFLVIIPHFLNSPQVGSNYWQRYAGLGNTPGEAILHLITQPWLIFTIIFTGPKLYYLWNMLLTGGLLGLLFAPGALLPATPELAINMLSNNRAQYSGIYHYSALTIAFMTIAAVRGVAQLARHWEQDRQGWALLNRYERMRSLLKKRFPWRWIPLWGWWLTLKITGGWAWLVRRVSPRAGLTLVAIYLLAIAASNFNAQVPYLTIFSTPLSTNVRDARIDRLLAMIPADASVSASDTLNPHLTQRRNLYLFPDIGRGDTTAEYIVVDVDYLPDENRADAIHTFDTLISTGQYRVIARADSVYLAKLQSPPGDSS